jgi:hypothetical protein
VPLLAAILSTPPTFVDHSKRQSGFGVGIGVLVGVGVIVGVRVGVGVGVRVGVGVGVSPMLYLGSSAGSNIIAIAVQHLPGAAAMRSANFPLRTASVPKPSVNCSQAGSVKSGPTLLELLNVTAAELELAAGADDVEDDEDDELVVGVSHASTPARGGPYGVLSHASLRPIGVSIPMPPQPVNG